MKTDPFDFPHIHDAFRPRIQRYLTRMVGESEAEDLTQEVFVKVNQALPTFRGECELSTWIYRIATNAAIDKIRTPSFRQNPTTLPEDSAEVEDRDTWTGEEAPSLEQQAIREDMYECFGDFVNHLPANYRTVFVLSELEQLTDQEIAEILGLSLNTVKIRLHRARTQLYGELRAHCKVEDWI